MTTATQTEIISELKDLLQINIDGREGFKVAREAVDDAELKTVFSELSSQRDAFAAQLANRISALGGEVNVTGSMLGKVHQSWIGLKAAITSRDPHAVLAECERAEDRAKAGYTDVQTINLDAETRDMLETQRQAVLHAHNRVKALRDSTK